MDKVKRIVEDIKSEKQRTDKVFQDITFEIRAEQVIMFFNYNEIIDTVNEDQNYVKHNHDPVFIDIQELNALKKSYKSSILYTMKEETTLCKRTVSKRTRLARLLTVLLYFYCVFMRLQWMF